MLASARPARRLVEPGRTPGSVTRLAGSRRRRNRCRCGSAPGLRMLVPVDGGAHEEGHAHFLGTPSRPKPTFSAHAVQRCRLALELGGDVRDCGPAAARWPVARTTCGRSTRAWTGVGERQPHGRQHQATLTSPNRATSRTSWPAARPGRGHALTRQRSGPGRRRRRRVPPNASTSRRPPKRWCPPRRGRRARHFLAAAPAPALGPVRPAPSSGGPAPAWAPPARAPRGSWCRWPRRRGSAGVAEGADGPVGDGDAGGVAVAAGRTGPPGGRRPWSCPTTVSETAPGPPSTSTLVMPSSRMAAAGRRRQRAGLGEQLGERPSRRRWARRPGRRGTTAPRRAGRCATAAPRPPGRRPRRWRTGRGRPPGTRSKPPAPRAAATAGPRRPLPAQQHDPRSRPARTRAVEGRHRHGRPCSDSRTGARQPPGQVVAGQGVGEVRARRRSTATSALPEGRRRHRRRGGEPVVAGQPGQGERQASPRPASSPPPTAGERASRQNVTINSETAASLLHAGAPRRLTRSRGEGR